MTGASGAEWFSFFADIAQIAGLLLSGFAVWLAARALSTWRDELRANTESAAALHCIGAARKLRDGIAAYRDPFRAMREIILNYSQSDLERHVLTERNKFHLEPNLADLREAEVRALVLWGDQIRERLSALTSCVVELAHQTDEYLRRLHDYPEGPLMDTVWYARARDTVKTPPTLEGPDRFGEQIAAAVVGLEEFLMPKIPTYLQEPQARRRWWRFWRRGAR